MGCKWSFAYDVSQKRHRCLKPSQRSCRCNKQEVTRIKCLKWKVNKFQLESVWRISEPGGNQRAETAVDQSSSSEHCLASINPQTQTSGYFYPSVHAGSPSIWACSSRNWTAEYFPSPPSLLFPPVSALADLSLCLFVSHRIHASYWWGPGRGGRVSELNVFRPPVCGAAD